MMLNKFNNYKYIYNCISKINNIKSQNIIRNICTFNNINNKNNKYNNINLTILNKNIIINNKNNINNNSILNKRYYSNDNSSFKKLSVLEIVKVYNDFIDSFEIFNKNQQIESIPALLNQAFNIQKTIIKNGLEDLKQLSYDDRLLYGGLFWELDKINTFLTNLNNDDNQQLPKNKINSRDIEDIGKIMDIEDESIKSPTTVFDLIQTQIALVVHNKDSRDIIAKSIQRLVRELKLLSPKEREDQLLKLTLDFIKIYRKIATNLGLWQEMIYLRSLIIKNKNGSEQVLTGITGGAGQYDLDFSEDDMEVIYEIVTRNKSISHYLPNDFIDINNYQPLKDDKLTAAYDLKESGKKSLVLVKMDSKGNSSIAQSPSKLLSLNENKLNKETGYYEDEIVNVTSMLILGRSIKLVLDVGLIKNLVHIGVMNQDLNKCVLVGAIKNSLGDYSLSVLKLNISLNSNNDSNSVQFEGTQTLHISYPDGESLLYNIKSKLNFETNKTNILF